ncbi:PIN domain-containing protein [bacterium]|nr:PIN domain-containing protein [bacterium]
MATAGSYLLDTNVVLHLIRETAVGSVIASAFDLRASGFRPLICEVTLGELAAFALGRQWGPRKRAALEELKRRIVTVDISDPAVIQAYAEISTVAQRKGLSILNAKNDLWIAAATRASDSTLLTTDRKEFLPLRDGNHVACVVLDATTGHPLP